MVAYTIDTVSVSLSSPNPNDGIFQVADAIGGLWWGTIYWGENDLLAWLPPVENCYLTISSSRFGHELLLRHPNGEAYPVLKGQTKGSLWFAPNGLGWQVSYYYFGATASCRPMLPWYVEDASNGERIGPNPTNAQLINWTAIAAPQNLAATEIGRAHV